MQTPRKCLTVFWLDWSIMHATGNQLHYLLCSDLHSSSLGMYKSHYTDFSSGICWQSYRLRSHPRIQTWTQTPGNILPDIWEYWKNVLAHGPCQICNNRLSHSGWHFQLTLGNLSFWNHLFLMGAQPHRPILVLQGEIFNSIVKEAPLWRVKIWDIKMPNSKSVTQATPYHHPFQLGA